MRKLLIFALCLISAINFIGCSQPKNNSFKDNLQSAAESTKWVEIYKITLKSYLELDAALNENIDFIAIDLSFLDYISDEDKKAIFMWFESRYAPVIDTNMDGLKAKGLFDEKAMIIPNGVLLSITKVSASNKEIIIEGMKYRGGLGANGFETKWRLKNDSWEFIETIMIWIS
ncbi:MAG: hypothetical protein LBU73_08945 [Helicobacteraceae bacterium]|jgi:hypothetical protein|nr:hypothetical protein [Helicobacteraceae bacterium]